jgi:hypothetical protein
MEVHLTLQSLILQSAKCDLLIAEGHTKNQNLAGTRKCLDAAAKRIDDVTNYFIALNKDVSSDCMSLMLKCMELYEDLADSEQMIAHFNEISTAKVNASNYHERHKFYPGVQ